MSDTTTIETFSPSIEALISSDPVETLTALAAAYPGQVTFSTSFVWEIAVVRLATKKQTITSSLLFISHVYLGEGY